jgi:Transposase DDE domain group 1
LRPGNAGSNTAADHVKVLDMALAQLPDSARPRPGDPGSPRVLARSDSAGATHLFAEACRKRGVEFSFGFPAGERIQNIVGLIPDQCWHPAIEEDGLREGAWVAEATGMIDLSSWPEGSRLILRKERPHPGAQLTFTDVDGHRITALLTGTAPGVIPSQAAGLELRHRQHARVEDRIREGKHAGLRNFPLPGMGGKQRLAGSRAHRRRPGLLGQADLLCPRPLPGPLRDRRRPLPHLARRRPAHPLRPPGAPAHRPHLAVGHPDRRRLPPAARRLRLTSPRRPASHHHTPVPACPRHQRKPRIKTAPQPPGPDNADSGPTIGRQHENKIN